MRSPTSARPASRNAAEYTVADGRAVTKKTLCDAHRCLYDLLSQAGNGCGHTSELG